MTFYVDSSAALKLVVEERGTQALRRWLRAEARQLASAILLKTEVMRATRRVAPELLGRARDVVDGIALLALTPPTFERASVLEPVGLRTLDAVHLAAALELADDLEGMLCYDERLASAAAAAGIAVHAPGR